MVHFLLQLTPLHQRKTLQPHEVLAEAYCRAMHIRPICTLKVKIAPDAQGAVKSDGPYIPALSKHKALTTWSSA